MKKPPGAVRLADPDAPRWGILRLPSFWIVSLTWFCFNFAYWGYSSWLPSYLARERHADIRSVGLLSGVPFVFGCTGLLLVGWLGTGKLHRHRPQLVSASYAGAATGLYLAYSSATIVSSLTGLSFAAFFMFGGIGVVYALAADLSPDRSRGTYWGAVSTTGQLGGVLAPWLIGNLVSSTGSFAAGFAAMTASLFLAAILVLLLIPHVAGDDGQTNSQPLPQRH